MTNQERNIRLAELLGYEFAAMQSKKPAVRVRRNNRKEWFEFNPCEDFNQLMPFVYANGITTDKNMFVDDEVWIGVHPNVWPSTENKDPRIALIDCLIKVLESKNEIN